MATHLATSSDFLSSTAMSTSGHGETVAVNERNKKYLENLWSLAQGLRSATQIACDPRSSAKTRENAEWFASDLRNMIRNDFGYNPDRIKIP